jgi:hypothetical protein
MVVLCILGMMMAVTIPNLAEARRAAALQAAAHRISALMYRCRAHAVLRKRATALVFERRPEGGWRCFIAEDGDGDGLRRDDLNRGRDRIMSEVLNLECDTAGLGILQQVRVPDPLGRGRLDGNLDDPVRAGRGDIITYTPRGTATPSSVYLTDYHARMRVLRTYGGSGRVYELVWRVGWKKWQRTGL